jgi:hypothetical protein
MAFAIQCLVTDSLTNTDSSTDKIHLLWQENTPLIATPQIMSLCETHSFSWLDKRTRHYTVWLSLKWHPIPYNALNDTIWVLGKSSALHREHAAIWDTHSHLLLVFISLHSTHPAPSTLRSTYKSTFNFILLLVHYIGDGVIFGTAPGIYTILSLLRLAKFCKNRK